jgi:hypothetical protein
MPMDRVVFHAWGDRYVSAPDDSPYLVANRHAIGPWEIGIGEWEKFVLEVPPPL